MVKKKKNQPKKTPTPLELLLPTKIVDQKQEFISGKIKYINATYNDFLRMM